MYIMAYTAKDERNGVAGNNESKIGSSQYGDRFLFQVVCSLTWENKVHTMIVARVIIFILELVIAVFYLIKYHDGS